MYFTFIKHTFLWVRRKVVLLLAATMLGISNAVYQEEKMINGDYIKTEKKQENDSD